MLAPGMTSVYQHDTVTDRFLDDFHVHCHFRDGTIGQTQLHAHRGYELFLCLGGSGTLLVGDRVYPLQPGAFALIKPYVLHWARVGGTQALQRVVLSIDDRYADRAFAGVPGLESCASQLLWGTDAASIFWLLPETKSEGVRELLLRLSREIADKPPYYEAAIHHLLGELFVELAREQHGVHAESEADSAPLNLAELVVQYLASRYAEPVEVSRLHEQFNVSRSHLYDYFKKRTGHSLNRYLMLYRINQAKRLLMDTQLTVTEVASAAGFGDLSHFFHLFKAETAQTPSAFRKQYEERA